MPSPDWERAGVALAGMTAVPTAGTAPPIVNVTLREGKMKAAPTIRLSATTLPAGPITLVVANRGRTAHGLAIMGNGLSSRRTPILAAGRTARLTVTLKAGSYHVWDPVQSTMSRAQMLTVKAVKTRAGGGSGRSVGGSGDSQAPGGGGPGGPGATWTTCIDPVTGEDHGPMDHPCDF